MERRQKAQIKMNLLDKFDITLERGFLPSEDPLKTFAGMVTSDNTHIEAMQLENFAAQIPKLMAAGIFRQKVDKLSQSEFQMPFKVLGLSTEAELKRAMMLLSFMGHAYMWGGTEPATTIPPAIARPWEHVASRLGRPPILSYVSYAHDNWYRLDRTKGITLDNIALLQNFLGGVDEEWFTMIHVAMEAQAGPAAVNILGAIEAGKADDLQTVTSCLLEVAVAVGNMYSTFCRMPERCDPYVYYTRVRPYIAGTKQNPLTPDGVVYAGTKNTEPRLYRGETGAQHSLVPGLDGALGVVHKKGVMLNYLMEMRQYMPPKHRAFIEYCETESTIASLVKKHGKKNPKLVEAYNMCLTWLETFRSKHLEYANTYIHLQSQTKTSVGSGGSTTVGTGGTPFMEYLTKHRDETAETKK